MTDTRIAQFLHDQVEAWNATALEKGGVPIEQPSVLVIEKSAEMGVHML